ncbi:MAG TPA: tetratricopeptide repeat protein [Cyclobacteriaceae bacterium]
MRLLLLNNALNSIFVGLFVINCLLVNAQSEKHNANWFLRQGELAMDEKRWVEAVVYFDSCLVKSPYLPDPYYSRGIAKEQLKDFNGALVDYNIYIEFKPTHFEALLNRASLRYRLGQYELAKLDFEKLITLPQGETSTVFFRMDAFTSSTNKIFTTQGSNNAYLYNYLGLTETKLNDFNKAIEHFSLAIQTQTGEADYYANRGLAKEKAGRLDEARDDYRTALKLNPLHEIAKHNLGSLTSKEGKKAESNQMLDDAISNNPSLPYPYAERGFIRMEQKEWSGALDDYNEAIRIDSTNEEYFLNRALVKEKLKDTNGAYLDYSKAISIKQNFEKAWLNRGNLLSRLNRLPEAIEDYTIAIFYFPEYATAYYNRGIANHRLRNSNEACKDISKAEELGLNVETSLKKSICK